MEKWRLRINLKSSDDDLLDFGSNLQVGSKSADTNDSWSVSMVSETEEYSDGSDIEVMFPLSVCVDQPKEDEIEAADKDQTETSEVVCAQSHEDGGFADKDLVACRPAEGSDTENFDDQTDIVERRTADNSTM